jgi:DNA-binding NarL/FixJ family response regulator
MNTALRVLLLEDNETDAKLIKRDLRKAGVDTLIRRVDSEDTFVAALIEFEPHVVLSDHSVAAFSARDALALVRAHRPATPVIIVTGEIAPHKAVDAVRAGAEDVILKSDLSTLPAAINEAVAVRQPLQKLSPRQIEVLRLVAEGGRTRDVARALNLSEKTVERHRGDVMKRLAIHDVGGLVRYAVRVGLISTKSPTEQSKKST